jgi:hypothetical protein
VLAEQFWYAGADPSIRRSDAEQVEQLFGDFGSWFCGCWVLGLLLELLHGDVGCFVQGLGCRREFCWVGRERIGANLDERMKFFVIFRLFCV